MSEPATQLLLDDVLYMEEHAEEIEADASEENNEEDKD